MSSSLPVCKAAISWSWFMWVPLALYGTTHTLCCGAIIARLSAVRTCLRNGSCLRVLGLVRLSMYNNASVGVVRGRGCWAGRH